MIRIAPRSKSSSLKLLADQHYQKLTPIIKKRFKNKKFTPPSEWGFLFDFFNNNLERIVTSEPAKLLELDKEISLLVSQEKGCFSLPEDIIVFIKQIFNYKKFCDNREYGPYQFLEDLESDVCPYCNRNFTINSQKVNIRATLDHFLPKSKHPYFALSFYNLVPSCYSCNLKKSDNLTDCDNYINPYIEDFSDALRFKFTGFKQGIGMYIESLKQGIEMYYGSFQKSDIIEFCEEVNAQKLAVTKAKNNVELFGLNEIYKYHKNVVCETILRYIIYKNFFEYTEVFNGLTLEQNEIDHFIFGLDLEPKNFSKKPLAKLTYDIYRQLQDAENSK